MAGESFLCCTNNTAQHTLSNPEPHTRYTSHWSHSLQKLKIISYDGNDPQGMIEAEEGGMECNSFDGGDMLDDSFDEIETKQRRLSNPDYELEIEMGRTGERDDKERP